MNCIFWCKRHKNIEGKKQNSLFLSEPCLFKEFNFKNSNSHSPDLYFFILKIIDTYCTIHTNVLQLKKENSYGAQR